MTRNTARYPHARKIKTLVFAEDDVGMVGKIMLVLTGADVGSKVSFDGIELGVS